nr:hypothetical protein GCM10020063_008710 [Dactylosporangium thailandense]
MYVNAKAGWREADIAASVNILVSKWNQLHAEPDPYKDTLNNDNADSIEHRFIALWAYNSGLHPYDQRNLPGSGGHFGLGWLNNPANPDYSTGRDGFLRDTLADAEAPNRWSSPERIMGWVETPQNKGGQFSQAYKYPVCTTSATRSSAAPRRTTAAGPSTAHAGGTGTWTSPAVPRAERADQHGLHAAGHRPVQPRLRHPHEHAERQVPAVRRVAGGAGRGRTGHRTPTVDGRPDAAGHLQVPVSAPLA